jgi:hypothetical protein
MATPEGRVKAKVKRRLKAEFGSKCWSFMPVQTGYGAPALDYLICIDSLFVAIETKAPGKKPTPLQETTIATIREAGGLVFVVEGDETLDAAIACIKEKQGAGCPV